MYLSNFSQKYFQCSQGSSHCGRGKRDEKVKNEGTAYFLLMQWAQYRLHVRHKSPKTAMFFSLRDRILEIRFIFLVGLTFNSRSYSVLLPFICLLAYFSEALLLVENCGLHGAKMCYMRG